MTEEASFTSLPKKLRKKYKIRKCVTTSKPFSDHYRSMNLYSLVPISKIIIPPSLNAPDTLATYL